VVAVKCWCGGERGRRVWIWEEHYGRGECGAVEMYRPYSVR
jgi:hypothetical protein